MNATTLVIMGAFVLLLWLHVIFHDRIQHWSAPWSRWFAPPENMLRVLRVLSLGLAVVVSVCYVIMLVAAAA